MLGRWHVVFLLSTNCSWHIQMVTAHAISAQELAGLGPIGSRDKQTLSDTIHRDQLRCVGLFQPDSLLHRAAEHIGHASFDGIAARVWQPFCVPAPGDWRCAVERTLPPEIFVPGHNSSQEAKCLMVGKRERSGPTSAMILRAAPTSIPGMAVRSTPQARISAARRSYPWATLSSVA